MLFRTSLASQTYVGDRIFFVDFFPSHGVLDVQEVKRGLFLLPAHQAAKSSMPIQPFDLY